MMKLVKPHPPPKAVAFPSTNREDHDEPSSPSEGKHHSKLSLKTMRRASMRRLRTISTFASHVIHHNNDAADLPVGRITRRRVSLPPPSTFLVPDHDCSHSPSKVGEISSSSSSSVTSSDQQTMETSLPSLDDSAVGEEQVEQSELQDIPAADDSVEVDESSSHPSPPYEAPDPFLVDSDEDEDEEESVSNDELPASAAHEIPLSVPSPSVVSPLSQSAQSPNLNKDVPPPPSESDLEEEEQAPEIDVPGLVIPTMFLPIPNTDPLTTLLNKYIYPPEKRPVRDLSGEWQNSDFHTLVMTNSWRALARMARDRIVTTIPDSQNLPLILGLWYLRLACLSRLRLFNQTSAECTNLFSVLHAIEPPEAKAWLFDRLLPFEIEVMYARLKYWASDHMSYLDALSLLLRKCKLKARTSATSDPTVNAMWKERGARLCLIIASQLMELKDFGAATKLLEPLCAPPAEDEEHSSALRSAIARIYLQGGYIQKAAAHFAIVEKDPKGDQGMKDMNTALLASANGEWEQASAALTNILARDEDNFVAVNNLSVALLGQGKLKEGIEVLEKALKASPSSVVVAEPFLFNLSTLYELRSATASRKKLELLIEVAKWSGDGLKTTCLKMPSN